MPAFLRVTLPLPSSINDQYETIQKRVLVLSKIDNAKQSRQPLNFLMRSSVPLLAPRRS